eukprot:5711821-Prymnesium_polylepis.2
MNYVSAAALDDPRFRGSDFDLGDGSVGRMIANHSGTAVLAGSLLKCCRNRPKDRCCAPSGTHTQGI